MCVLQHWASCSPGILSEQGLQLGLMLLAECVQALHVRGHQGLQRRQVRGRRLLVPLLLRIHVCPERLQLAVLPIKARN